jgi:hypothetical protein
MGSSDASAEFLVPFHHSRQPEDGDAAVVVPVEQNVEGLQGPVDNAE